MSITITITTILLVLLVSLPSLSPYTPCPPCGSTPVPFPLSTSPSCNDPLYPITCNTSTHTLSFHPSSTTTPSLSYPITSITLSTQRLVLRPAPFLSPTTCVTTDLPYNGLSISPSLPFNITSSNTLLYLNCTSIILLSPLNCSSGSLCHAYTRAYAPVCDGGSQICCTLTAGGEATAKQVRASVGSCSAYRSFVGIGGGGEVKWVEREGVELQWLLPREPLCAVGGECGVLSNATCRVDGAGGGVKRCFCDDGFFWDPINGTCAYNATDCSVTGLCHHTNNAPLIAGLVSGIGAALLVSIAFFLIYRHQCHVHEARERLAHEREEILNTNNPTGRTAHNFTGREIKKATSNFSKDNFLGAGGFGEVYKGILPNGTPIAVKLAKLGNSKSTDQVLNEVRILSQVNHRGLVRLLGCCVELEQPLMVYEFIPNGTLFEHLHDPPHRPLSWRHRLAIAHRTAEGLAYLHFAAVPPIYHRDVKSSNILLDEQLNVKVSDFGLSRLAETDLSHVSTCAQGTLGYLDPEYYRNYQLTDKSDVYSFGVVLLELLTSLKAIDFTRGPEDVNLVVYVQRMVEAKQLMDVVDPWLKEGASEVALNTMKAVGFLAVSCLEERRQNRPSMKEVSEELEYIIRIEAGGVDHTSSDPLISDV